MKKNGFTLVEFLIGITMTAMVFVVATNLVIAFLKVDSKSQRNQELEQAKSDLSSEFTNSLQWASYVNFDNGVLKVDKNVYQVSGEKFLKNNNALTGNKVLVSDFLVQRVRVVSTRTNPTTGSGLLGFYFDNSDLTSLKGTRVDKDINFSWGSNPPIPGVSASSYSVKWVGQLEVPKTGLYTFYIQSNSGSRLSIDNSLILDNWLGQGGEAKGSISLTKGKLVDIVLEYLNSLSGSNISLMWSGPSVAKEIVPSSVLYPEESQYGYQVDLVLAHNDSTDTKDQVSLFIAPRIQTGQTIITE